ncbi:hypothetical protein FACS1894216_16300 [Synergistales bacterium]|nr:hypothetical protein FACS1894216_16300 [Synergistales bacterium]
MNSEMEIWHRKLGRLVRRAIPPRFREEKKERLIDIVTERRPGWIKRLRNHKLLKSGGGEEC